MTIGLTALITTIVVGGVMYVVMSKNAEPVAMPTPTPSTSVSPSATPTSETQPDLSLATAQALAMQKWGGCIQEDECEKMTVTISKNLGNWYVTAIVEGLHDDSITATRTTAHMDYQNGSWTIGAIEESTWKCSQGRGHQDFSRELCY